MLFGSLSLSFLLLFYILSFSFVFLKTYLSLWLCCFGWTTCPPFSFFFFWFNILLFFLWPNHPTIEASSSLSSFDFLSLTFNFGGGWFWVWVLWIGGSSSGGGWFKSGSCRFVVLVVVVVDFECGSCGLVVVVVVVVESAVGLVVAVGCGCYGGWYMWFASCDCWLLFTVMIRYFIVLFILF